MWAFRRLTDARLPRAFLAALVVLTLMATVAWRALGRPATGIDDADIFLTYAQTLLSGRGFVYGQNDVPVEGVTSLPWLAVCAASLSLPVETEAVLRATALLLAAATVSLWITRLNEPLVPERARWAVRAGSLLWVSSLPWLTWNILSLMDTALWCSCVMLGVSECASSLRGPARGGRLSRLRLPLALALLTLARPEGVAFAAALAGTTALSRTAAGPGARPRQYESVVPAFAAVAGTALVLLIWRLTTFGWMLPNTFYAKVSYGLLDNVVEGLSYLRSYATLEQVAAVGLACGIVLAVPAATPALRLVDLRPEAVVSAVAIATQAAIIMAVGGDHFEGHRFLQPVYPLMLTLLLGVTAPAFQGHPRRASLILVLSCACQGGATWGYYPAKQSLSHEFEIAVEGRRTAEELNTRFRPEFPSVAVFTTGGFGYRYAGRTIDMLGLNNPEMAHARPIKSGPKNHAAFEPEVLFQQRPALVLPRLVLADTDVVPPVSPFVGAALKDLLHLPRFKAEYAACLVAPLGSASPSIATFVRRDSMSTLLLAHPNLRFKGTSGASCE